MPLQAKVGNPARVTRTVGASQYSIHAPPDKTARNPNRVPLILILTDTARRINPNIASTVITMLP
jgi:hypothetical protein